MRSQLRYRKRIAAFKKNLKFNNPTLKLGDTVRLKIRVYDEHKSRIRIYKGVLVSKNITNGNGTFNVCRSHREFYTERNFMTNSTIILSIVVLRRARVRRAKLYYLRSLVGKAARLREYRIKLSTRNIYAQ